ncbi:MAG: restriction endonuclease subunit S, partial [Mannheimia varigena]|nr:restriction endonuclease subunit S [Mannheimia varigena]
MASPKLRFKEFSLDWELKSLGSITKWYSGGTPSKDIEDYWGNGYPLISGASMHTDLLEESNVHITALGLQNGSKLAPKNSILLLVRGSMLFNRIPVGIAQKDLAFNQDVKCLIPSNGVLYQFIFQWFKSKESFIKNKVTSTGIGAGKLDTDDLQNLSFFQPTEKEQTKIASFLTTIDKKISQLNEQHQLMIQYKKGVMQKIFSQEIRF